MGQDLPARKEHTGVRELSKAGRTSCILDKASRAGES